MKNPPHGGGEVALAATLQELSILEEWVAKYGRTGGQPPSCVSGEPTEGTEFSIETMTEDGMHRVIGITASRAGDDPGQGHPSEEERAVLGSVVKSLLDLMSHDWGPATTVAVLAASGPRVLACRLHSEGGGRD